MRYFLVMELTKWAEMEASFINSRIPLSVTGNGIGFMKVYADEDLLKKEHPGKEYIQIEEKKEVGHE